MAKQDGTTRGYLILAVNPRTGSNMDVLLPVHRIQWARKMGLGAIMELDQSVSQVLARPRHVWEGLIRDEDDDRGQTEGWLCYCGVPTTRYDYQSGKSIPIGRRVLLVFVNKEHIIYHHRWEIEDENQASFPADIENRFSKKLI